MAILSSLKRLAAFASTNVLAQGVGALSGILLVRWMPVNDYAIYSVFVTIAGAITILTKGGAHLGLASILGRTWPDLDRASSLINATLIVRKLVSAVLLPLILLSSFYLMHRAGADLFVNILLCSSLAAFWWADMRTRVVDQILFFSKDAPFVQMVDLSVAVLRLGLIFCMYVGGTVAIIPAAIINVIGASARIKPISNRIKKTLRGRSEPAREQDLREMKRISVRQIPTDIFFVCQAQIAMGLLITSASSAAIATYGAVSRISQLLSPVEALALAFFVPSFSSGDTGSLKKFLLLILIGTSPGIVLSVTALMLPELLLWPLGQAYSNQADAMVACTVCSAFNMAANIAWSLAAHRGWNCWGWVRIPFGLIWCVVAPFILSTDSVPGAFLFYSGFSIGVLLAVILDLITATRRNQVEWKVEIRGAHRTPK